MDSEGQDRLALVKWVKSRTTNTVALKDLTYDGRVCKGKRVKMRGIRKWHTGIILDYDSDSESQDDLPLSQYFSNCTGEHNHTDEVSTDCE